MTSYEFCSYTDSLVHHGIKGQKWGIRRYQNPDGTLTPEGRHRYAKAITSITKAGGDTKKASRKALGKTILRTVAIDVGISVAGIAIGVVNPAVYVAARPLLTTLAVGNRFGNIASLTKDTKDIQAVQKAMSVGDVKINQIPNNIGNNIKLKS